MNPRASAIVAALTLLQVACVYHWQDQRLRPDDVIRQQEPVAVRVTKVDSTQVVLRNPQLADSSLVGVVNDSAVSIPLAAIASVAVRKPGAEPEVAVVMSVIALGVFILLIDAHSPP